MHHPNSEVTYANPAHFSPSANVERYLLMIQERQYLGTAREYMGDSWALPSSVDIPDRPPITVAAEPVVQRPATVDGDADGTNEGEAAQTESDELTEK